MVKPPSSSNKADDALIIVKTMLNSSKAAKQMAKLLVKEQLAACVQVVPGVTSFFHWDGKLCSAREYMVLAKTMRSRYEAMLARILALHNYDNPEILVWEADSAEAYRAWVKAEVSS